jgi:hypothetical protein
MSQLSSKCDGGFSGSTGGMGGIPRVGTEADDVSDEGFHVVGRQVVSGHDRVGVESTWVAQDGFHFFRVTLSAQA